MGARSVHTPNGSVIAAEAYAKSPMDLPLFDDSALRVTPAALPEGAHHLPQWLTPVQQRWIVERFREWTQGPVPARAASIMGKPMSVSTVCLGWHWRPYAYSRTAVDVNGARVLDVPDWLKELGRRALESVGDTHAAQYSPDAVLANYYPHGATMGMHQDKDEQSDAPVVSLSIGDSCTFRLGNTEHRNRPYQDVHLRSGDLFVFGGPSRMAFHGVTKVFPQSAPAHCGLPQGRINLTLRETGLSE